MITVVDLVKKYGDLVAVNKLNFQIGKGETFGLLGPNGAGKSTTIGMIIGLIEPDSGHVEISGKTATGNPTVPEIRKSIGISPQSLSLYEDLTAKENLEFFGSLYGLTGKDLKNRSNWSLEFAALQDRANDRVKTFSGGMKRRLNIASALIHEPEIILLDEPTVGVDPQSRNHIFDSIERLKKAGTTIIYTTHYMEEAQRLCDRVAIVDHGKLLDLNTVDELIHAHGGQSVLSAEVRDGSDLSKLNIDSVKNVQTDGNRIRFESEKPFEAITALKDNYGVQIETFQMARPDLESVFLNLTGRSLRD